MPRTPFYDQKDRKGFRIVNPLPYSAIYAGGPYKGPFKIRATKRISKRVSRVKETDIRLRRKK